MSTQPEALRLADALIERHGVESFEGDAAAELRRLHAENEAIRQAIADPENQPSQFGTVTLTMYEALEAQRDALLEALKRMTAAPDLSSYGAALHDARAAIAKVEGEKT